MTLVTIRQRSVPAMSKVSVCLTHYNRPEKLAATLESLASQTKAPDEVFVQDDCSPNDPTEVARAFQGRFKHFVYERNENNLGMPGNLNKVIRKATGDFVANLHDADEFHPQLLEKWVDVLSRYPSAGLVFCGYDAKAKPSPHQTSGRIWIHDFDECTPGRDFFERVYVGSSSSPIWGTVMVRREVYDRHLPFDARFGMWSDVDMWMRVCGTHDIAYVAEPLIILDNTDTPVRSFHWRKVSIVHSMHFENIRRLGRDAEQRAAWLAKQRSYSLRAYVRHLVGRATRGDLRGFAGGCLALPRFVAMTVQGAP